MIIIFLLFQLIPAKSNENEPKATLVSPLRHLQSGPPVPDGDWESLNIELEYLDDLPSSLDSIFSRAVSFYSKIIKTLNQGYTKIRNNHCLDQETPQKYLNVSSSFHVLILISYSTSETLNAWGVPCELSEDQSSRPIMGRIHLEGDFQSFSWEEKFGIAMQQIAHVLAYDYQLVPFYLNEMGEQYGSENVISYNTRRNTQKAFIKTPKVLKYSKQAFQCLSFNGMETESSSFGASSSITWEARLMKNDFMSSGFNKTYVIISKISLALFEDSGWYRVDYDYGSDLTWGSQSGCGFMMNPCVVQSKPAFNEFCNSSNAISFCDHTHTYKGTCSLSKQSKPIPAEFQYFNDSHLGGSDSFADYCPSIISDDSGSCLDIGKKSVKINEDDYGESSGSGTKCLEGTYINQLSKKAVHLHAACHKVTCEGNVAVIHVGGEVVFCDPSGGRVSIRGYDGFLFCPSSDVLCRDLPCPFACSGRGKCRSGRCDCESGSGRYCENFSSMLSSLVFSIILLN